jgi:putative phosphoesterase
VQVAVISDIHANLPALNTVIEHALQQGCDEFWNLGDTVGYGPFPEETVQVVRRLNGYSIRGNYDRKVLAYPKKKDAWRKKKQPLKFIAFGWAYKHLSKESRKYLKNLPTGVHTREDPFEILLTHGSPASDEELILPSTPGDRLREIGDSAGAQIILCGHSHIPFDFRYENWRFINPGSVGRPGDQDTRTSYTILDFWDSGMTVRHFRLPYDLNPILNAISHAGLPDEFAEMFRQGKSLDDLLVA